MRPAEPEKPTHVMRLVQCLLRPAMLARPIKNQNLVSEARARLCSRPAISHLHLFCTFRTYTFCVHSELAHLCAFRNFCVHFTWSQALLFHPLVRKNNCRLFLPPPALPFRENVHRLRCCLASPHANTKQNKPTVQSLKQNPTPNLLIKL